MTQDMAGTSSARRTRRRRRGRGETGAAMVEYALGVALLVVVTIPAVDYLTDSSEEVMDRKANSVGAPDLAETGTPVTLPPPTTTLPGGSIPPPPESVVSLTFSSSSTTVQRNVEWAATVGILATDDTGNERELVTVSGEWSGANLAAPVPMSCSTNLGGRCALTLRSLPCGNSSATAVTFTVTGVSGEGVSYLDPLPIAITVNRPSGTGQNSCG